MIYASALHQIGKFVYNCFFLRLRTRVVRALVTKIAAVQLLFCREEVTRTPDPHVPNVVRYQLRYFSVSPFLKKRAKLQQIFDIRKLFCIFFAKITIWRKIIHANQLVRQLSV